MLEPLLNQLIELHPDRGIAPACCVKAICFVESSFDEFALRYEPGYKWLVGDQTVLTATERMGQMCSWGLMQVMGGVARETGFTGSFPRLCDPFLGLRYGIRHLLKFYTKYGDWPDALAAYNAGSPRKAADGKYLNDAYVQKVLKYWTQFEKHIPIITPPEVT